MKYNHLFYTSFCLKVLSIAVNPRTLCLLLQLYQPLISSLTLLSISRIKLSNTYLSRLWYKSPRPSFKHLTHRGLDRSLLFSSNTSYSLQVAHLISTSSNYSSTSYLKIVNTLLVNFNLQYLLYINNCYFRGVAGLANFSLLALHYLISNRHLRTSAAKPTNCSKSLFLINIKKL